MLTVIELARRINKLIDEGYKDAPIFCYVGEDGIRVQVEPKNTQEPFQKTIIYSPGAVPVAGGPGE